MTDAPPPSRPHLEASVLEVRDVTVRFPGVVALERVSFELRPGQVHALVGENGAGKSSLIKVLTGVYHHDEGEIRLEGRPVSFSGPASAQAAGISTIYQEIDLIPLMTVAQNIFLGREPRNRFGFVDYRAVNSQSAEILRRYGIKVDVTTRLSRLGLGGCSRWWQSPEPSPAGLGS